MNPSKENISPNGRKYNNVKTYDEDSEGSTTNEDVPATPHVVTSLSREDKIGVMVLLVLYCFQGIPLGLFAGTIKMVLTEKGADMAQLGIYNLVVMPFSLKFLAAPFLDTYFSRSFGKRKTYIVPLQYIYGLLSIFLGYHIDQMVESHEIGTLTIIGFAMIGLMALQDIAVDGWALTLLQPENVSYGSTCQSIGQSFGVMLSFNLLVPLNSLSFCNNYLYSSLQTVPLLSLHTFCILSGVIVMVGNLLIQFFKKEKNPTTAEFSSMWDVWKSLLGFWHNKNLRFMVIVLLTWKIGISPIDAVAGIKLIQGGFSIETLTNISTLLIPLQFANSIIVGRRSREKKEMTIWVNCLWWKLLQTMSLWLLINFCDPKGNWWLITILILITSTADVVVSNGMFVTMAAFNNRICDPAIGGTFMTTMAALTNFGRSWTDSFALYLENYFPLTIVAICGWIYTICYLQGLGKRIVGMETKDTKEFAIIGTGTTSTKEEKSPKKPVYVQMTSEKLC